VINLKFNKTTTNNLKKALKTIKLNESSISMVLGLIVVFVIGTLVISYLKSNKGNIPEELLTSNSVETSVKTHKTAKGENLWDIAVTYYGDGFRWVDIATENKLANASVIETGQELIIPDLELEKVVKDEKTEKSINSSNYAVVKGDSLWTIALRSYGDGYKWVEIAKINKITNPNVIHTGNVLILPR